MSETFLNNAQLTGLSKDARRTEILRAKAFAALSPGAWQPVSLASANWTVNRDVEWRLVNGDTVEMRGSITRTTSTFTAGADFLYLSTNSMPLYHQVTVIACPASIAAASPTGTIVIAAVGRNLANTQDVIRTATTTHAIAVGDTFHFDQIRYTTSA